MSRNSRREHKPHLTTDIKSRLWWRRARSDSVAGEVRWYRPRTTNHQRLNSPLPLTRHQYTPQCQSDVSDYFVQTAQPLIRARAPSFMVPACLLASTFSGQWRGWIGIQYPVVSTDTVSKSPAHYALGSNDRKSFFPRPIPSLYQSSHTNVILLPLTSPFFPLVPSALQNTKHLQTTANSHHLPRHDTAITTSVPSHFSNLPSPHISSILRISHYFYRS
jgi:hypothetical protein